MDSHAIVGPDARPHRLAAKLLRFLREEHPVAPGDDLAELNFALDFELAKFGAEHDAHLSWDGDRLVVDFD